MKKTPEGVFLLSIFRLPHKIQYNIFLGAAMKRNCKLIGLGIFAVGFVVLVSSFLPLAALVYIEAALLMIAGILYFCL
jgi:hypothetical protein